MKLFFINNSSFVCGGMALIAHPLLPYII
ncbi:hypothetical protein Avbf_08853 [Armadillidium vulgare]|nr:hypothetical protein Avbf_08853 [Armadillidium vulgare]